jgi:23S rRNA (uracil1939-C5)-methyltransferase
METYAYGGETIGRLPDGRVVFVPFTLPGEKVRADLVEEKRGHARARLVEVLEPSPLRVMPRCLHYGICGGCHYQHLPYPTQLEAKTRIVRDQLERIGGFASPPVDPAVPSPQEWNYRSTVQFHLNDAGKIGYQAARTNTVVQIQECHLPEPPINEVWPQLDFDASPDLERVSLRLGNDEDILLSLESGAIQPPSFETDLPISAVFLGPAGQVILSGDDTVTIDVHGRSFRVSAGSFFQVNTRQAERMVRHLLEYLPLTPGAQVLELYCGVGLFSAFLAPRVQKVIGVEVSPSACADFAANLDEFDNVELYQAAAEEVLEALSLQADILLVDPPRTGLDRRVVDSILQLHPPFIAYVSCDPSTLARDARRLNAGGYELIRVTPFDLFPQTFHIETIAFFTGGPVNG